MSLFLASPPPFPTPSPPNPQLYLCQIPNLDHTMEGWGWEVCLTHHTGNSPKALVSLKSELPEACAPDSFWPSSGPGLAPRGPELSQLFLNIPTKSACLSLHSSLPHSLLQTLGLPGKPPSPRLAGLGGTAEETGVCQGLGKGGRRRPMPDPPLGGGGGVQMEQSPPVPPTQLQTEPASPSNGSVSGVGEEGGG